MGKPIQFQPTQTLGEILALEPRARRVFEDWDIDYYCGGGRTLAEACGQSRGSLEELQDAFSHLLENAADYNEELEWCTTPFPQLTGYIVRKHHAYLRKKLPELLELAQKVSGIHAEDHPETAEVHKALAALQEALVPHLAKEEEKLFPSLCALEDAVVGKPGAPPPTHALGKFLPLVFKAHDHNNGLLAQIRKLTRHFHPPEDACYSFQRLWKGLRELEKDMHCHLHLENNVLLARAQDYEKRMTAARPAVGP